jgi:phospholipid/cholesterol/gamma-HCH transport system substrate-binding protein
MSAPANHWKLGLFVLVGTVLTLTAAIFFGTRSLRKETVDYTSYFDEAVTGLEAGSPVKFRGVTIGNVSVIDIAPDRRHVQVTYQLGVSVLGSLGLASGKGQETTLPAPPDLRAQLGSTGLTGVKYIQIDFFDVRSNPAPVLPFHVAINHIPAAASTMKNLEGSVVRAVEEFPKLASDLSAVLGHVNFLMTDVEQQQLPAKLNDVLANANLNLNLLHTKLDQIKAAELSNQAQQAIVHVNAITSELESMLVRIDGSHGVLSSVQRASDSVGDVAVSANGFGPELGETMRDLREAAGSVRELADALELDSDMLLKGRAKAVRP